MRYNGALLKKPAAPAPLAALHPVSGGERCGLAEREPGKGRITAEMMMKNEAHGYKPHVIGVINKVINIPNIQTSGKMPCKGRHSQNIRLFFGIFVDSLINSYDDKEKKASGLFYEPIF